MVALPLPPSGEGWLIDTPGLRGFGLAHIAPERVVRAFPDLAPGTLACPRGCTHLEPEPPSTTGSGTRAGTAGR